MLTKKMSLIGTFLFIFFLYACGGSDNGTVNDNTGSQYLSGIATLRWQVPTTNEDNSKLEDLAGYKLYYGTSSAILNNVINLNDPMLTSYVIDGLSVNTTYFFAISAVDFSGNESVYSNIVSKYIRN